MSLSMARTAQLSWLQLSNRWTNDIISILPPVPLLIATAICHGITLLPYQSVWLSRNFLGGYFIALSKTSKTEVSSRSLMTSSLQSSWFFERNRWDFQEWMCCFACEATKTNSFQGSFVHSTDSASFRASSILLTTDARRTHRSHVSPTPLSPFTDRLCFSFTLTVMCNLVWNSTRVGAPSPSYAKLRPRKGTDRQIADIVLRSENTCS